MRKFLMPLAILLGVVACGPNAPDLPLLGAIDQQNVAAVQQHMDAGTDPNTTFIPEGYPFAGASALHLAVLKDNAEIVDILLKSGAQIDIKAKDVFGSTPLIWAAFWGVADMVPLLVERGASLDAVDVLGNKPLDAARAKNGWIEERDRLEFAVDREVIIRYLEERGS